MVLTRSQAENPRSSSLPSLDGNESVRPDLEDSANNSYIGSELHFQHTRTRNSGLKPKVGRTTAGGRTKPSTKSAKQRNGRQPSDVDTSDSESDTGSEWDVKRGDRPVAKRSKKNAASAKGKKAGRDLSALLQLSLDVFIEIFSHLTPIDLIRVARANKAFKALLVSKSSATIWNRVRGDVPPPPADFSELRWAALLFDCVRCQNCNANGVFAVEFFLRRRLCNGCKKANYVCSINFTKVFPEIDLEVEELLPYTHVGGWAHGYHSKSRFYWTDDVYTMSSLLATHKKKVHMRVHGARKAMEDFKVERRKLVADTLIHAAQCEIWARERNQRAGVEESQRIERRLEQLTKRFVALGYKESDVQLRYSLRPPTNDHELTDATWKRIRPRLERRVRMRRDQRVRTERPGIVKQRENIIKKMYKDFKASMPASKWALMPTESTVTFRADVASIVHEDSDRVLTEEDFAAVIQKLPDDVEKFIEIRKQHLLSLIAETNPQEPSPTSSQKTTLTRSKKGKGRAVDPYQALDSVCSVFQCTDYQCRMNSGGHHPTYFSWSEVGGHHCHPYFNNFNTSASQLDEMHGLRFLTRGIVAVKSLMDITFYDAKDLDVNHPIFSLDPEAATPMDLDKLDARVVCEICHNSPFNPVNALTWRGAVDHFLNGLNHREPKWILLSPKQTLDVKSHEEPDPWHAAHVWVCNHCAIHVENADELPNVLEHIKTKHGIADPVEDVDFLGQAHMERSVRKTVLAYPNMRPSWTK